MKKRTPNVSSESSSKNFKDCLAAIRTLNSSSSTGTFHTAGINDTYKLPVITSRETCKVAIDVVDKLTEEEQGSWRETEWKAEMLALACVDSARKLFGGFTHAGARGRIRVSLVGS